MALPSHRRSLAHRRPLGQGRALDHAPTAQAQRGLGLFQVLIVLLLVVFFVNIGIKMAPSYLTFFQVRGAMERVVERPEMAGAAPRAVLAAVNRQLGIDGVRSIDTKDFRVKREGDDTLLSLDYQVQEHIGLNVDVLMHFEHAVVLPQP